MINSFAASGGEQLLFTIFVMFVAAKLAAEIFERLKQPAVAGEILAGVVIGPSVLGLVAPSELTEALSEIGVIFLLFLVGLETKPADIFRVGWRALLVAVLGVIVPFIAGYLIMLAWGESQIEAIFVGAAMVATSVGITARVLGQMGLLDLEVSRIILGAAVIDDILGLLILAVVSSLAKEGGVNYVQIGTTAALAVGFTLLVSHGRRAGGQPHPWASRKFESRAIVPDLRFIALPGAGAGRVLHWRRGDHRRLPRRDGAVRIGRRHGHAASSRGRHRIPAAVLFDQHRDATQTGRAPEPQHDHPGSDVTILAALSKLIGCGLAALPLGKKKAAQIGMGMVPRGEVGVVVAQIGLSLNAVDAAAYGVVLFMAVATTLIAPPFLVRLFREETRVDPEPRVPITQIS